MGTKKPEAFRTVGFSLALKNGRPAIDLMMCLGIAQQTT